MKLALILLSIYAIGLFTMLSAAAGAGLGDRKGGYKGTSTSANPYEGEVNK